MSLGFPSELSINQLVQEVHVWQSFITFGLRQPSYIDEIMLTLSNEHGRLELFLPGRRTTASTSQTAENALFRQSTFSNCIEERLQGWRQQYDCMELAILIFTGAAFQDSVYLHTTLLNYLQALEVLHRESYSIDRFPDAQTRKTTIKTLRDAVPTSLNSKLQKQIKESLSFIGSVTLLDRLNQLYLLYPQSVGPLFKRGEADMAAIKDVRNFLTHYSVKKDLGKDFLWSRKLIVLKEKVRLLLETCLLGSIGMTDNEIQSLLNDFAPYQHWRMEDSIEFVNEIIREKEN